VISYREATDLKTFGPWEFSGRDESLVLADTRHSHAMVPPVIVTIAWIVAERPALSTTMMLLEPAGDDWSRLNPICISSSWRCRGLEG